MELSLAMPFMARPNRQATSECRCSCRRSWPESDWPRYWSATSAQPRSSPAAPHRRQRHRPTICLREHARRQHRHDGGQERGEQIQEKHRAETAVKLGIALSQSACHQHKHQNRSDGLQCAYEQVPNSPIHVICGTTNASAVPAIRPTIMRIISDTPLYLSATPRSAFEIWFIFSLVLSSRLAFASQHNKSTS